jgi:VWFA-related protein
MPRGKTVLIIFDARPLPAEQAQKINDSAVRFVREHMQPQDLFGVVSGGGSMRIIQNLTDDKEAVIAAIAQAARYQGWGPFDDFLKSIEQINYSITSIKGPKSVFIFGRPSTAFGRSLSELYGKALSSARKSNVIYYVVDTEPTTASGIILIDPNATEFDKALSASQAQAQGYEMRSFAAASGGSTITGIDTIDTQLDRLNQQISNYYILGFQSSNQKHEGAYRKVRVTTSAKDAKLKYQPGYQDRRPIDVLPSSKQEQMLLTALATPGTATQLPIAFRPSYFYDSSGPARVLIAARIRTDKIALRKKDEQIGVDLNIMGAAYAENGSIAARFNEILPISLDKGKEPEFRKQDLPYSNYLRLRPGKYRLKLAVSDESNNLGSMEENLEVPARPDQGLACSSLVVSEQLSKMPHVIEKLQTQLLDHADPLYYAGTQIQPSIENKLPADSTVPVLFRIYNLPCRAEECSLAANPKLLGEKGEQFSLAPINLKDVMSSAGPAEAVVGLRLPFQNVPPGKYRLVIELKETGSAQSATLQTDLEFIPK